MLPRHVLQLAVGLLLLVMPSLAGCETAPVATAELGLAIPQFQLEVSIRWPEVPEPEPLRTEPRVDPRVSWCEPLDQPFCEDHRDCSNGTRCLRPWWANTNTTAKVCAMQWPTRATQRWQAKRIQVYVNHVCKRSRGCDPIALMNYIETMVDRESAWRWWKRHWLSPDVEAATDAFDARRTELAANPAINNPDRWMTGLGLLAQNPAIWISAWDPLAPPEALCGEVEAIEAHLRIARNAVNKILGGVDCNGDGTDDFWGTSCEHEGECQPSWYDVSRVNSGSLCPGNAGHQRRFERRAKAFGLDPWDPVWSHQLGDSIPRDRQDEIAAELRTAMDAIPR